jgi:hypothetical protein
MKHKFKASPFDFCLCPLTTKQLIAVLKELEGLARGGKDRDHIPVPPVDPEHAAKVAEAAKTALAFLRSRSPGVRCVTTRGTVIHMSAFTMEEDTEQVFIMCTDTLMQPSVSVFLVHILDFADSVIYSRCIIAG